MAVSEEPVEGSRISCVTPARSQLMAWSKLDSAGNLVLALATFHIILIHKNVKFLLVT
jgi:hypothetical protein